MYSRLPSFVLGFHGCGRSIGEQLVAKPDISMIVSQNSYDWLGHGVYFWENSYQRAAEWARTLAEKNIISEPFVIGAVIDLGKCLNLVDREHTDKLVDAHKLLCSIVAQTGNSLPENKNGANELDCAVINLIDKVAEDIGVSKYDTVRAPFIEGKPVYSGANFCTDTHMQICVREQGCLDGCIKGLFHIRK